MLICADLEVELYSHVTHIAEQSPSNKYRAISMYLVYLMRLFRIHKYCTPEDNIIFVNCLVLVNSLVFHPKEDPYNQLPTKIDSEERKVITSVLGSII